MLLRALSLLLIASAAVINKADKPSIVPELTLANFKTTTAKGQWFVKHYSPSCPHCVALAPFWEAAGEKYASLAESNDFHLASVDCMMQGDLCHANGIKHYPMLFLYQDGVQVDEWVNTGSADPLIPLSEFIEAHVNTTKPAATTIATARPATPLKLSDFKQPAVPINPSGTSINLTPETFTKQVTGTKDPWFIKFYAPWCGHCKAMAPAWTELASEFKDKLNIGEVNCEAERRLCADVKIKGYPTILFFTGEKHIDYSGLRGVGDLVAFAKKAHNAKIRDVDAAEFETIEKTEGVIFLYFYDDATTSEDFDAIERLSLELIGHSLLLKTSSSILAGRFRATTFPKLTVIRDGKPQYYPALGPADMRDHTKMLAWMKTAWLPMVPELSAENSHEIMQNKLVVLAVLDPESSQFDMQRTVMKEAAFEYHDKRASEDQAEKQAQRDKKQAKIEEAEKKGDTKAIENAKSIHVKVSEHRNMGFAWVNGIFWEKWLAASYQINIVRDGARIIVYDENRKRYWDTDTKGNAIPFDKKAVSEVVSILSENPSKIRAKSTKTSLEAAYLAARNVGTGHPLAFGGVGLLLVAAVILIGRRARSPKGVSLPTSDREKGFDSGKHD